MATSPAVETVTNPADKAKLGVSAALVVAALAAFYLLAPRGVWVQVGALLLLLAAAVGLFFTSQTGRDLIAFGQDAWKETKKVVWPTRQEAMQMTLYVFGFVFVMALFLWITDKTIEWVLYDLILGWRR